MILGLQLSLALRYVFTHEQAPLSRFLSLLAAAGLVLAVALMSIVLSVMNGFDTEMRTRILAVVPHLSVMEAGGLDDPDGLQASLRLDTRIAAMTPFIELQGLAQSGSRVRAFAGIGVVQTEDWLLPGMLNEWSPGGNGVWVGTGLAAQLALSKGSSVTLIVPSSGAQAAAVVALPVVGLVATQTELDQALMLLPIDQARSLLGYPDATVSGIKVQLRDVFAAASMAGQLQPLLEPTQYVRHWGFTHGNLYAAIQMSRDLMVILMAAVILIAAFNVVSGLVLLVTDKRQEVAILATMGFGPRQIAGVFLILGGIIGAVGSLIGVAIGYLVSVNIGGWVAAIERAFGFQFLNTDVYPIAFLPSAPDSADFLLVAVIASAACVLAAVYPAMKAAQLAPARVLSEA